MHLGTAPPSLADDEHRRNSVNSNGTNPSFTPSSVTTGNRVHTSDDDHTVTPEVKRVSPGVKRKVTEAQRVWGDMVKKHTNPPDLPTGRKKVLFVTSTKLHI